MLLGCLEAGLRSSVVLCDLSYMGCATASGTDNTQESAVPRPLRQICPDSSCVSATHCACCRKP
jgi:hypothetical protein